ncbi:MAG: nitroreductase family deazaflavin-dependent oxidoreductase [Cryobacterium sp.]|nr:nitroreductase family deazaflavin-dependent oxidoreductase [Cryobacterium sp.]
MRFDENYLPSPREFVRRQVELYERSDGTEGNTGDGGYPVVIISCRGAKTGAVRKFPVIRVEHDGDYVAVASFAGRDSNPVWYQNLIATPLVDVQDGAVKTRCSVRELSGRERDSWWSRAVEAYPPYAEFQSATERVIPVLLLTPVQRERHDPIGTPGVPARGIAHP